MNLVFGLVGAIVVALTLAVGYNYGSISGAARVQKQYDTHLKADDAAFKVATENKRLAEEKLTKATNDVAAAYEKGKKDAEAEAALVVADLRAGSLSLRNRWAGCETGRLSEAAVSTRILDAATRERAESAGRIVRAATECDKQVIGLQDIITGYQNALNP